MPKKMPIDTKRRMKAHIESFATSRRAEQQRRNDQTDALYKAAIEELLNQEPPPANGVDQIINQGLVDAFVKRLAEIHVDRFGVYVANQLQLASSEEHRKTLWEMFGSNGTDQ